MSTLLIKRLARSLWRTKLRLFAVLAMVTIGVMAGISFGSYANNAIQLYDHIYADTEEGVNLPDLWVENAGATWDGPTAEAMCETIRKEWPDDGLPLKTCEPRLRLNGLMVHSQTDGEAQQIDGIWHGIDEGTVQRVWLPKHDTVDGRIAQSEREIVLDAHAAHDLEIHVGDQVSISAGAGLMEFSVVGIGYHADHLFYAKAKGDVVPASADTLVTGYMTASGLERLADLSEGSANLLLLDIEGTPPYDLQSTPEKEGEALAAIVASLSALVGYTHQGPDGQRYFAEQVTEAAPDTTTDPSDWANGTPQATLISDGTPVELLPPTLVYDRSQVYSVELLRADAEGAQLTFPYVTGMLALIAGITIFLSLQRLIQSQAREIAILRTLGIGRKVLMPAYVIAPLVIGAIGAAIGTALGVGLGAPGMQAMYEDIIGVPVVVDGLTTDLILQNVSIAMVLVFLSGIWPAWKASRMRPLDVLRGQHEVRLGSRRIQRWTARLPATIGLTIRSSIRKPMRLFFTFLGVGLSMLLFGSMLVMMGAMDDLATGGFEDKETWDAQVSVAPGGDVSVMDWAKTNGVESERLLQYPANPKGDPRQFIVSGHERLGTETGDSLSLVKLKEGALPQPGAQTTQVLIDEGTSVFLEWQVGETHTVMFGERSKDVEITGITQGEMLRTVHFHQSDLAETIGLSATSVLLKWPDEVEIDDALGALALGITLRQDTLDTFAELMEKQKKFFNAILFLGILIAAVVLFNTLLMNLAERDQELATLRVLGAPIKRLGTMLFLEHLAIGLIGGLVGCIFSIVGAQAMIQASVQWAFYFTVKADMSALGIIMGIVVFIAVALTPFGMRRIRKMDLVEKVKAHS